MPRATGIAAKTCDTSPSSAVRIPGLAASSFSSGQGKPVPHVAPVPCAAPVPWLQLPGLPATWQTQCSSPQAILEDLMLGPEHPRVAYNLTSGLEVAAKQTHGAQHSGSRV